MNELISFENLKFQYEIEDLHDVFGTVLDKYPNYKNADVSGHVYLWEHLQRIKTNLLLDIDVETYLIDKYVNGEKNKAYDKKKSILQTVCYNASFNGSKSIKNVNKINNIMFLDIDRFKTKEEAISYKNEIIDKYDWIISCYLSLSKVGLHIIIMTDEIRDNNDFNKKYDYISSTYFDNRLDKNSKSITRHAIISFDFNIFINNSPNVLEINKSEVFKKGISSSYKYKRKKNILSEYNEGGYISGEHLEDKVPCSAYIDKDNFINNNKQKGIRSSYKKKKKIIYTPYTFSFTDTIQDIMNKSARSYLLKLKQELDESYFDDPDKPYYSHEGINVIEINLFPYLNRKVIEGNRTATIGSISAQMIYINKDSNGYIPSEGKNAIYKFIKSINNKICQPPLSIKEVRNSFNANWDKYKTGTLDVSPYFKKKKSFWSNKTTLKGNEKRKITCKIKNEPIRKETMKKMKEAVNNISIKGEKVTQSKIADIAGISVQTVKKYKEYYWELKEESEGKNPKNKPEKMDCNLSLNKTMNIKPQVSKERYENDFISNEFKDSDEIVIIKKDNITSDVVFETVISEMTNIKTKSSYDLTGDEFNISDNDIDSAYERIFELSLRRIPEDSHRELKSDFKKKINQMTNEEKRLLFTPYDKFEDDNDFHKQSTLEINLISLAASY